MRKPSLSLCCLLLCLCFFHDAYASTATCRTRIPNAEVLAYQGGCVDGYLQGRVETVIQYVSRDGTTQRRKQFGWFERGTPTGLHVAPGSGILLQVYDKDGASKAIFLLPAKGSAMWQVALPQAVEYTHFGDPTLYLVELEKKDNDFFYPSESARGKVPNNIGRLKDILWYGDIYARSKKEATSVGNNALLLYLDSLPVNETAQSKEQLTVNKILFPDSSPALGSRLKLQDKENLVYTREGCGVVRQRADSLPQSTQVWLDDSYLQYSWQGECVDGLSLGEGRLLLMDAEGRVSIEKKEWHLWGRRIGKSTLTFMPIPGINSPGRSQELFSHEGNWYLIQNPAANALQPRPADQNPPTFLAVTPQHQVAYQLLSADEKSKPCGFWKKSCLSEASYIGGKIGSDSKTTPCAEDCGALLQQKAAPLIAEFNAVVEQHRAETDALKASVAPLVAAAREKRLQDEKLMAEKRKALAQEQARVVAAKKEKELRLNERTQALNKANQSRRPVGSPNLDALLKKVTGATP